MPGADPVWWFGWRFDLNALLRPRKKKIWRALAPRLRPSNDCKPFEEIDVYPA